MALGKAKYFSTLDLVRGCWQVPVGDQDHEKTTFIPPVGLFEFNYMLFRLSNAPSKFQCLMERYLVDFNFETVLVYLEDIIIFSKTFKDYVQHLDWVFTCLAEYGFKLQPSKCRFMRQKIQYLGHIMETGGESPWTQPKYRIGIPQSH